MKYILFLVLSFSCLQVKAMESEFDLNFTKQVLSTNIEKVIQQTGVPSISVVVIHDDSVVWDQAFGYSNLKLKTPATTSTVYSTGSTTKPFLSMAIMQLVEKGLLDLDEPVNQYLKSPLSSFSPNSQAITLRHLLSHQSGLPSSAEFVDLWGSNERKSLEEITKQLRPIREPGKIHEYSNDGFVVAAIALENVTAMSYGDYVYANILEPLDLDSIDFIGPSPDAVEDLALPYKTAYGRAFPIGLQYSQPYPAGGNTYLSPQQMARFLMAHLNEGIYLGNRLIGENAIKEFHQTSFNHEYYGLGMAVDKKGQQTYLWHTGAQQGYTSMFKMNLSNKTGVYFMSNALVFEPIVALTELATELLNGEREFKPLASFASQKFKAISLSRSQLEAFEGRYQIEGVNLSLDITTSNGKAYLINPKRQKFEIIPYSENQFFLKTEEQQIEFVSNDGQVEKLILKSKSTDDIFAKKTS